MKTIRAKFRCTSLNNDGGNENITMSAVYGTDDKDNKENNQFAEATPWGDFSMGISNPDAKGFFKEGGEYYLDFSEAVNK